MQVIHIRVIYCIIVYLWFATRNAESAVLSVRLLATGVLFSDGAITRCGDLWKDHQRIGELVEGLCPAGGENHEKFMKRNAVKHGETW